MYWQHLTSSHNFSPWQSFTSLTWQRRKFLPHQKPDLAAIVTRSTFPRLEAILTNRLILNLRTLEKSNISNPSTRTDIFFHQAYGGTHGRSSFMDSVLGNIGAPLRVEDENDEHENNNFEGDREAQDLELLQVHIRTSVSESVKP